MKFICDKNNLSDAINTVQKAVSQKSTLPVLEGILIECGEGKIILTGNDLEIGIRYECPAQILEEGTIVLNSRMFGDIVRKLPDAPVQIESDDKYLTKIICGNVKFDISGIDPQEFPRISDINRDFSFNIKSNVLRSIIKQTIYVIPQTSTRPVLTGAYFEVENNKLSVVGSDRFRVAIRNEMIDETNKNFSAIIPVRTLGELLKIVKDDDTYLRMYFSDKNVLFEFDDFIVLSRLRDGEYINYKNAIPQQYAFTVKCNVADLENAVDRASLIISNESVKSPLTLNIRTGEIEISCSSASGKINDVISVDCDCEPFEIKFNLKFLLDSLKNCDCEEIHMKFITSGSPCVMEPVEGNEFMYLVLPMLK